MAAIAAVTLSTIEVAAFFIATSTCRSPTSSLLPRLSDLRHRAVGIVLREQIGGGGARC